MDAWSLSSRKTVRPRFDSLRDHVDIKAFLKRRKNNGAVHEIKLEQNNRKDVRRDSMSPEDRDRRSETPDTGFESRRGSLASQIIHWGPPDSRNDSLATVSPEEHVQSATPIISQAKSDLYPYGDRVHGTSHRRRHHHHGKKARGKVSKMLWLIGCLIGSFTHFFVTTYHYMKYETATETVTGMPLEIKIPATAVCFPIWSLIHQEMLSNNSACLEVTTTQAIEDCEHELFGQHLTVSYVLHNLTQSPIDLINWIEIRKPNRRLSWITDVDLIDPSPMRRYRKNQTNVKSYYRGPDKCLSFHPVSVDPQKEPEQQLSIDQMSTAKSRMFFSGTFKVNAEFTPQIRVVRMYVHESRSYPRGSHTLPVVTNLTKGLSFTISYTKIETTYLPAPYFSKCVDYHTLHSLSFGGQALDSKQHCTSRCVRHKTKADPINPAIPANHLLMRDVSTLKQSELNDIKFMPSDDDSEELDAVEQECAEKCRLDCLTRNYYTSLSESDIAPNSNNLLQIKTRFENPETSVKFLPKLDFEAYVIYVAGVFSIWFSASVYHSAKNSIVSVSDCISTHRQLIHRHHGEKRREEGPKPRPMDPNNNISNVMSY